MIAFSGMPIYAEKTAEESSEAQKAADNYLQVIYDNSEAQNLTIIKTIVLIGISMMSMPCVRPM